jgi:hypothetical protein
MMVLLPLENIAVLEPTTKPAVKLWLITQFEMEIAD